MIENLLDPAVLCFGLGLLAGVLGTDIRLPGALYETLSVYLLLAIGLKGGVDLASAGVVQVGPAVLAALAVGTVTPLLAYPVLRLGRVDRPNAGALAAHYGSVSAVTFAVCLGFLEREGVSHEPYVAVMLAFMEIPALAIGILLARGLGSNSGRWGVVSREILLGKGVFFLVVGLTVGAIAGPQRIQPVAPVFFGLFKGALVLFLLEMGLVASRQLRDLARLGPFLLAFGTLAPLCFGLLGALAGVAAGLSVGGAAVLSTLAASASYIAAPAAIRLAVPEANPSIYLTTSLGITFPFNLLWGIPLYLSMARFTAGLLG